jgi:hypothetical protein
MSNQDNVAGYVCHHLKRWSSRSERRPLDEIKYAHRHDSGGDSQRWWTRRSSANGHKGPPSGALFYPAKLHLAGLSLKIVLGGTGCTPKGMCFDGPEPHRQVAGRNSILGACGSGGPAPAVCSRPWCHSRAARQIRLLLPEPEG